MLAIRLPEPIEQRLNALAQETGRSKTTLAREAILEFVDDLEDYYLAESHAAKIVKPFRWTTWSASLAWAVEFDPDAVKDLKNWTNRFRSVFWDFCAIGWQT